MLPCLKLSVVGCIHVSEPCYWQMQTYEASCENRFNPTPQPPSCLYSTTANGQVKRPDWTFFFPPAHSRWNDPHPPSDQLQSPLIPCYSMKSHLCGDRELFTSFSTSPSLSLMEEREHFYLLLVSWPYVL